MLNDGGYLRQMQRDLAGMDNARPCPVMPMRSITKRETTYTRELLASGCTLIQLVETNAKKSELSPFRA